MSLNKLVVFALMCVCVANAQNILTRPLGLDILAARNLQQLLKIAENEEVATEKRIQQVQDNHRLLVKLVQQAANTFVVRVESGPENCRQNLDQIKAYIESRKEFFATEASRNIVGELKSNEAIAQGIAIFAKNVEDIKNKIENTVNGNIIRNVQSEMIKARTSMEKSIVEAEADLRKEKFGNDEMIKFSLEYNSCLIKEIF